MTGRSPHRKLTAADRSELDALDRTRWFEQGNCLGQNVEVFIVDNGAPTGAAKAICTGCPVVRHCLRDGELLGCIGIRGGLSAKERRSVHIGPYGWQDNQ